MNILIMLREIDMKLFKINHNDLKKDFENTRKQIQNDMNCIREYLAQFRK